MADAPVDTPDVDIEDVSLVETPIAPKDDAPSEPAEQGQKATADTPDEPAKSDDDKPSEGEDQTPAEPQPQPDKDAQAEQRRLNAEAAARRVQERQRTRQTVQQQIDENYAPKSEEQLVEEGYSQQEAQIQALREEMAFKEQRTQIAEMNAGLQAEAVNVYNDFPVFNPDSKQYDPEFAQMVEQQYMTAARLQTDNNGLVLNAEQPLYDFYQRMNNIYSRGASQGSQQGQQEALQMLARTENVGGSSASGNSSDALADLEERLGDVVIT
jgi:hypothetical protein